MRPIRPIRAVRPTGAPLIRGLVVGGAAYAAGRSVARSSRNEQDQNAAIADLQAQQAAPPPAYQLPALPDLASKLTELGQMVQQGLLTAEEFAIAKARLLA
ncbi:hypothetical protein ASE03_14315 [Kitasatospora sp. Root187]|nr:hypothetical protein ASC99_09075 [Kitasatospora sp. Root107]KRB75201.1 hypothetical protein ASE03_14315 [Kitasatospora sp. Root187]